jgi:hypothetical protein
MLTPGTLVINRDASKIPVAYHLFAVLSSAGADTYGRQQHVIQALRRRSVHGDGITFMKPMVAKEADLVPLSGYGMVVAGISRSLTNGEWEIQVRRDPNLPANMRWGDWPWPQPHIDNRTIIDEDAVAEIVVAALVGEDEMEAA